MLKEIKNSPGLQARVLVKRQRIEIFEKFVKYKIQIFQKSQVSSKPVNLSPA